MTGKRNLSIGEPIGQQRFNEAMHKAKVIGSARLAKAILRAQLKRGMDPEAQRNNLENIAIHKATIRRLTARVR